ncbi:hypothetical protein AB0I35_30745 [Nocardia sp. NPDC050378]|uniref:hypothetical protein n=1 Tax=Nocardia sp. NPDC050378 TaxID=3155400 RepID=UPI0033E66457
MAANTHTGPASSRPSMPTNPHWVGSQTLWHYLTVLGAITIEHSDHTPGDWRIYEPDDLDEPGEEIAELSGTALSDLTAAGIRVQHRDGTDWRPLTTR